MSVWVEILLDKFASHRPTGRLLQHWQLLGVDLAPGTVTEGLRRLEPLFTPLYEALRQRNRHAVLTQCDETRWLVFGDPEGKVGHTWWLWVFGGADTVLRHEQAGGGGYGDPLRRDPAAVVEDIADGKISADFARRHFGVVLDGSAVSPAATTALRQRLQSERRSPA